MNNFVKAHGLGNEYIVLNSDEINFTLSTSLIQKICNVHYGIGSDGILLKVPSSKADFGLRIFNPDGSEAEKSGNGLRIFSKYLYDYNHSSSEKFTIETPGGLVTSEIIEKKNGKAFMIKVDMGKAIFTSKDIPVSFQKTECFGEELVLENQNFLMHCVSVGNPHCVITTETLDENIVRKFGPIIETYPMFPNRINVQFAKVISRNEVEILIWERGAGYTLASGSSSSAVACALIKKGLIDPKVTIKMPGGILNIEVADDWNIRMTGEVSEVAYGILSNELVNEFES